MQHPQQQTSSVNSSRISNRKLIQWSPQQPHSHFVVGSNDIRLYNIVVKKNSQAANQENRFSLEEQQSSDLRKREQKFVSLLGVNYEVQMLKCLAWCPPPASQSCANFGNDGINNPVVATGLPNGKVMLVHFSAQPNSRVTKVFKEFVPKHSRSCNALAWNPVYTNQLACGLDKVRGDCSTIVWDVNQSDASTTSTETLNNTHSFVQTNDSFFISPMESTTTVSKPLAELGNSEATVSLAWLPSTPSCLVSGTGMKWLRIYDLRGDRNAPKSVVAHGKSVHVAGCDPFLSERIATYSEDGIVKLWDTRKFAEPFFTFNTYTKGLSQVEWCPTRNGILASIGREERSIKFWDIADIIVAQQNERDDPLFVSSRPTRVFDTQEPLSSFSWHPSNQYRILTVSNSGIVELVSLHQSIPVAWSPHGNLTFTNSSSKMLVECVPKLRQKDSESSATDAEILDISHKMKCRALQGYSMDINKNKQLMDEHPDLYHGVQTLWNWMHDFSSQNFTFNKEANVEPFQGIATVLKSPNPSKKLQQDKSLGFAAYTSIQRSSCLQICGWGFERKEALEQILTKLEGENQNERAAAIAVFHLDIKRAILSLTRGLSPQRTSARDGNLQLVAMALAGCNEQSLKSNLWKEVCLEPNMVASLKHPYLRACFNFLCDDTREFKAVLEDSEITLCDRVAFACKFLDDQALSQYIDRAVLEQTARGSLDGIILTGLDPKAIDIFENYINLTGDVQTASLVLSYKKINDTRVQNWVTLYRDLLDTWQLWHERAKFDIARRDAISPQVFVRCNFCNQQLAMNMVAPRRGGARGARAPQQSATQTQKITNCPGCKKPLPNCSLCLLPFNCIVPSFSRQQQNSPSTPFENWFTWCQTCRHGGHAIHMMEWFQTHNECPVTDCKCIACASGFRSQDRISSPQP